MIVDGCLFAQEDAMLELRVRTLCDVVDAFVIVSCSTTHQGEPAPPVMVPRFVLDSGVEFVYFVVTPVLHRVDKAGQIQHRHETDRGKAGESFFFQHVEKQHRAGVLDAVRTLHQLDNDMVVMVSDVDEIPTPDTVAMLPDILRDGMAPWVCCEQRFHSTALDLLHPYQPWLGTMAARLRDLEPQRMRDGRADARERITFIERAGWHLSWFGTDAERQRKLDTFSHAELRGRFDPQVGRAERKHPNGEELRHLSMDEVVALDWPAPIVDRTFTIPDSWWSE